MAGIDSRRVEWLHYVDWHVVESDRNKTVVLNKAVHVLNLRRRWRHVGIRELAGRHVGIRWRKWHTTWYKAVLLMVVVGWDLNKGHSLRVLVLIQLDRLHALKFA